MKDGSKVKEWWKIRWSGKMEIHRPTCDKIGLRLGWQNQDHKVLERGEMLERGKQTGILGD